MLVEIPKLKEIKDAIFSLGSHKFPWPSRMSTVCFIIIFSYKFYRNIIGGDVLKVFLSFFSRGYTLKQINHIF